MIAADVRGEFEKHIFARLDPFRHLIAPEVRQAGDLGQRVDAPDSVGNRVDAQQIQFRRSVLRALPAVAVCVLPVGAPEVIAVRRRTQLFRQAAGVGGQNRGNVRIRDAPVRRRAPALLPETERKIFRAAFKQGDRQQRRRSVNFVFTLDSGRTEIAAELLRRRRAELPEHIMVRAAAGMNPSVFNRSSASPDFQSTPEKSGGVRTMPLLFMIILSRLLTFVLYRYIYTTTRSAGMEYLEKR